MNVRRLVMVVEVGRVVADGWGHGDGRVLRSMLRRVVRHYPGDGRCGSVGCGRQRVQIAIRPGSARGKKNHDGTIIGAALR